jgi:hypothetical protein
MYWFSPVSRTWLGSVWVAMLYLLSWSRAPLPA